MRGGYLICSITAHGHTDNREQPPKAPLVVIHSFVPFDPTAELWDDYWARFQTFVGANSIPTDKTSAAGADPERVDRVASHPPPPPPPPPLPEIIIYEF